MQRSSRKVEHAMSEPVLSQLVAELAGGRIRIVDLTQTLSPDFPQIVLPPEMGQAWPFRIEETSRYDARGPGWYWNNFSCSEHTGTHFDAPIHWISGRHLPDNSHRYNSGDAASSRRPACSTARAKRPPTPTFCSPSISCASGSAATVAFRRDRGS